MKKKITPRKGIRDAMVQQDSRTAVVRSNMVFACISPLLDGDLLESKSHALFMVVYPGLSPVLGTWYISIYSSVPSANIIEEQLCPQKQY